MFGFRARLIVLAALTLASGVARADGATVAAGVAGGVAGGPGGSAALVAERQNLRSELERVNAEIDAIKRDRRGLRDDYRLRARMADAEALARRLIELDARLGNPQLAPSSTTSGGAPWPSPPVARPSDDRSDLEAKADILSDQSRRLNSQADTLALRVADLRGRHELRRRASQLERDPFSPLEQAKRRIATAGPAASALADRGEARGPASQPTGSVVPSNPPPGAAGAGAGPPVVVTGIATGTDSAARTSTSAGSPAATPPAPLAAPDAAGSVAAQFRGVLDAATLADIRRLENPGSSAGALPAMERALSALRARAAQLEANAGALRSQAQVAR